MNFTSPRKLLRYLDGLTLGLFGCAILTIGGIGYVAFFSSSDQEVISSIKVEQPQWPKNPFALKEEAYQSLGEGVLELRWKEPQLELPDLRKELVFYGKNGRPDCLNDKELFQVGFKDSKEIKTIRLGQKIYLTPVKAGSSADCSRYKFQFSSNNKASPLWIEVVSADEEGAFFHVKIQDENGTYITQPEAHGQFSLPRLEPNHGGIANWEIGGHRVDGTLLVRQRARWMGVDKFIERYGGDEYLSSLNKQRIDFFDELPYACFVDIGDFLIWKEGRWHEVGRNESTANFPLLVVKKVDEKVMHLEVWDQEGRSHVPLTLIRTKDYEPLPDIENEFRFLGAKTWSQFIVECRGQRLVLKPNDWVVLTQDGWKRISSIEEVDDYVEQRLQGPLFVLDHYAKENGRQILKGHLFNASRTEELIIELPAQTSIGKTVSQSTSMYTFKPQNFLQVKREDKCDN